MIWDAFAQALGFVVVAAGWVFVLLVVLGLLGVGSGPNDPEEGD